MTLSEFHAMVRNALGRGTSLDDSIPSFVRQAVYWLERNYTFQYMKRWMELTTDPTAEFPHIISLYNTPIKKVQLLRYVGDDERFHIIARVDPADRATRPNGIPSGFWLDGLTNIVLDSRPDEALVIEAHLVLYSPWSTEALYRHYMMDYYEDLLFSRSMMNAATRLRDPKLYDTYKAQLTDALVSVNVAEEDLQYGSQEARMEWAPVHDEFDPGFEADR